MPSQLENEILENFRTFSEQWPRDLSSTRTQLDSAVDQFGKSYVRVSSIHAWRGPITTKSTPSCEAFFLEALNDLLISHCLARCGSFRQALKSLRAAIENIYFFLFYKDHPIELEKWEAGRHRPGFTELHSYFESHPRIAGRKTAVDSIEAIKSEYATLSKAVHGSAKPFRMTANVSEIRLWDGQIENVGRWTTREKSVISSINVLMIYIFADQLQATAHPGLREVIALSIPKTRHISIKADTGVTLIAAP